MLSPYWIWPLVVRSSKKYFTNYFPLNQNNAGHPNGPVEVIFSPTTIDPFGVRFKSSHFQKLQIQLLVSFKSKQDYLDKGLTSVAVDIVHCIHLRFKIPPFVVSSTQIDLISYFQCNPPHLYTRFSEGAVHNFNHNYRGTLHMSTAKTAKNN